MILLGSFLHRQELADIIGRALEDRLLESDARRVKQIINFNSYAIRIYSNLFAERLFRAIHGDGVQSFHARTKGALKDLITTNPPHTTPRIDEMLNHYNRFPEDFYRETPYEARVYKIGDPPRYAGSRRIKRIRRVAEKCARRLVDYMFDQIRQQADELAIARARSQGIPKESLITPREEMEAEFRHAERRVLKSIRDGLLVAAMPQFYIDDIVGVRVVVTPETLPRIEEYIATCPDVSIFDRKYFAGKFQGRNMVVACRLPHDQLLEQLPDERMLQVWVARGVAQTSDEAEEMYRDFVRTAEGHVRLEILLIEYEALLESELGRSMHEEHIQEQRENQAYRGRLAQNVEALMFFMFAYAFSTNTSAGPLPIRVGSTYLPDYFDSVFRDLTDPAGGTLGFTM